MKKVCALVVSLILLLAVMSMASTVSAAQIVATEDDVILLAGSDFQVSNVTWQIEKIFSVLEIHGLTKADGAFFVGDYTAQARETETSAKGIEVLKKLYQPIVGDNMIFTQGNHDHVNTAGLAKDGNNDPASGKYGVFVINENQRMEYNDDSSYEDTKAAADALKIYLDEKAAQGYTKPIFVLNHIGLHWGNRTVSQGVAIHAELLVKVLNEAGAKGLNIIYLYGHNHSGGYDDAMGAGAVYFKKGDQIEVAQSDAFFENAHTAKKKHTTYTLNFTYMNAGYIGYYSTGDGLPSDYAADATVTMSVFLIRGDEVIITRYDSEINLAKNKFGVHNLKSAGVWHPDWQEAYHNTPNTLVYASSRKVTATSDVEVESPRYSAAEDEWEDDVTTTTTKAPTTTQKPTQTDTTIVGDVTTTTTTSTSTDTAVSSTDVPTTSATTMMHDCVMPEEDGEEDTSAAPTKSFPIGLVLGIGGGVILATGGGVILVIGAIVIWILLKRKK